MMYQSGDHGKGKNQRINKSCLWRLMRDYKLDYILTLDDLGDLIRLINADYCHNKGEIISLDYRGFKHFLLQISLKCFPEAANLPPSFAIKALINHLLEHLPEHETGKMGKLFSDPEYAGYDDADVIHYLNGELAKDPEYEVPETFEKCKRKEVTYFFELPECLAIPERWRICYEIMDDLISDQFEIHIMEPYPDSEEITYVKPTIFFSSLLNKKAISSVNADALHESVDGEAPIKPVREHQPHVLDQGEMILMFTDPRIKLSTNMKMELTKFEMKDKANAKQTAFVLEELLQKVENNDTDPKLSKYVKEQYENKIIKKALKQKALDEENEKLRNEKYDKRKADIKVKLKELHDERDKKKEEETAEINRKKLEKKKKEEKEQKEKEKKEKTLKKEVEKEKKEREKAEEKKKKEGRKIRKKE